MQNTKAIVIHEILRQSGKRFRLHTIYDETGVSPQNTANHLRRLVSKGLLIKTGTFYTVSSQEALVDELVTIKDGVNLEQATGVTVFFSSNAAQNSNDVVDRVVRARVLDLPQATDMHVVVNQKIDEAQEQLKKLKRWLNTKTYAISSAEKNFNEEEWEALKTMFLEKE